nr:hypothetical protein [Tanacetum cinerariifolium]
VEGDVNAANAKVPTVDEEPSIPSPTPPTSPSQPSQDIPSTSQAQPTPPQSPQVQPQSPQHQPQQDVKIPMNLLQEVMDTYTALTRTVGSNWEKQLLSGSKKSQSNLIYKIAVDLLKNTNFFRAFTASSGIPSIYIQQFWDTILYDKKAGCYKCQLDEQWEKEGHSDCDSKHLVYQADYPSSSEEAQSNHRRNSTGYILPGISGKVRSAQPAPTSAPTKPQEKKRKQTTETSDKPPKEKKSKHGLALEESMKDAYALPKGSLLLVVIREPESRKYQPLPEVPGKG